MAIKVLSPQLARHSSLAKKRFAERPRRPPRWSTPMCSPSTKCKFAGGCVFGHAAGDGESLAQRLAAQGRLGLTEVLRIRRQPPPPSAAARDEQDWFTAT